MCVVNIYRRFQRQDAEDEHDQRLHEAVTAEEKRPAGQQRETKAQEVQQAAAAVSQKTPRLGRTLVGDHNQMGRGAGAAARGGGPSGGLVVRALEFGVLNSVSETMGVQEHLAERNCFPLCLGFLS